jgi:putative transposase
VRRSYKFRAYPTARQEIRARQLLADHCDLYNAALQERRDAYRHSETKIR